LFALGRSVVLVAALSVVTFGLPSAASAETRYVAPAGSDQAPCTVVAPCATFERAYRQAAPGDSVEIAGGSYGHQTIPSLGRPAPRITFRPALGASVTVSGLDVTADHVTVRDVTSQGYMAVEGRTEDTVDDLQLYNVHAAKHWLAGSRDFLWKGGSIGPSHDDKASMIAGTPTSYRATYDGVLWHDATRSNASVHTECLMALGVQGLTIRNSRFVNCAVFNILISKLDGDPDPRDVLIENTVFGETKDVGTKAAYHALMTGALPWNGFVLRNNVWEQTPAFQGSFTNARITSNIGPMSVCQAGIAYSHNVFTDRRCGATDVQDAKAMSQFVSPGAGDFRLLPGASAIDRGDPLDSSQLDALGYRRRGLPDAGAFEFGGIPPESAPSGPGGSAPATGGDGRAKPPAREGLVGAWGFEEPSGALAADASPAGNTGVISGARRVAGRHGRALRFDGVNDLVTIAGARSLRLRRAMTLEAWVKPSHLRGSWRAILVKERSRQLAYGLYAANRAGRPSGHAFSTRDTGIEAASRLKAHRWTHLAITWDGRSMRLYRNAREVARAPLKGTISSSGRPLRIGGNRLWSEFFKGTIDDVRVYDRALRASEIAGDRVTPVPAAQPSSRPAAKADRSNRARGEHRTRWLARR
jgi:hypothetical protein